MSEAVRSFVAVDLPAGVRDELGRLQARLKRSGCDVRWVRPDRIHVTLVFLGEVEPGFIEMVKPGLAAAADASRPFSVRLGGIGAFPTPGRARVVWAGVTAGAEELIRLQSSLLPALKRAGFQPESRPFSPHLTLGRLRVPADVARLCTTEFASDEFEVSGVTLFRSVLRPEGPEYSKLASFGLASGAAA